MVGINIRFNIALLLYLFVVGIADYLFRPESHAKVPWDMVWSWSPAFGLAGAFILLGLLLFWGAGLVKFFWNAFISDIFRLRNITYNEALSLILILAICALYFPV
jgi:hypothetical protein